jgi:hypothetical protein
MKVQMGWMFNSGNARNMHKILLGKLLRRRILGGQRAWEDKVKVKLTEIRYEERRWGLMHQNCIPWRVYR